MPGGKFHSPIWTPYALYGTVDYIYGWPAWNDGVGFTAAQAALNIVESFMYAYYLYALLRRGEGSGWYQVWDAKYYGRKIVVQGDDMAFAVVTVFSAAVMTVSKTVLYCKSTPSRPRLIPSRPSNYRSNFTNSIHRAERVLFKLRQRRAQRPGQPDRSMDHPQRCLARGSIVHDLRLRQGDHFRLEHCWPQWPS
jgi:hypothetical protein